MGCRYRGVASRCRSPGKSRSCLCCRDAGPCRDPVGHYHRLDDEAPGQVGARVRLVGHRRPSDRQAYQEAAAAVDRRRACRSRASGIKFMALCKSYFFFYLTSECYSCLYR